MAASDLQSGPALNAPAAESPRAKVTAVDPRRRALNDAPLRTKLFALLALAAVGGALLGRLDARLGHPHWVLLLGLLALLTALSLLGRYLVWRPVEHLLECWFRLNTKREPGSLQALPVGRQDEVGQLARAIQQLAAAAIRDTHEARSLRRTLDWRVLQATRRATAQLLRLAMRDPLTDLGNRRFLDENLDALAQSVLASGSQLACVAMDLDNFKQVNDRLGHAAGDQALVALAGLIKSTIRPGDYAVRLGGDEFVVLLPDCPPLRVEQFTRGLRALFHQHVRNQFPPEVRVDLSMGVAFLGKGDAARRQADRLAVGRRLLRAADDCLYAAKSRGKGCTVTAEG